MERVAFLIEKTGARVACLLNPETFTMQRTAGIQPQRAPGGMLTGARRSDDPLIYTGGGRTVLELDLLFDVNVGGSTIRTNDVRALTLPIWQLAENTAQGAGYRQPPQVRFIWGKAWNIPCVVVSVAERFEYFSPQGVAQRSWLRLRLWRVSEEVYRPQEPSDFLLDDQPGLPADFSFFGDSDIPDETWEVREIVGDPSRSERLDQIAGEQYGDPARWRLLAAVNNIDNPLEQLQGTLLRIPLNK